MEQDIRAAIGGDSNDLVLNSLVELTVASLRDKRPLFNNILDEPALWRRHFRRMVQDVLDEEDSLQAAQTEAMRVLSGIQGQIQ